MEFNLSVESAVGLDISSNNLKIARISFKNGQLQFDNLIIEPLKDQNSDFIKSTVTALLEQSEHPVLSTTVSSEDLLIRPLSLNINSEKDIPSVLDFQVEPLIPFPIDQAVIDWVQLEVIENTYKLSIFALPKKALSHHLDLMHKHGLEPESVSCIPAALAAFAQHTFPQAEPQFLLNLSEEQTLCLLTKEGNVLASHSIHMGYKQLAQGIATDKNCTLQEALNYLETTLVEADQKLYPELYKIYSSLEKEILRTQKALYQKINLSINSHVVLTGEHTHLIKLSSKYTPVLASESQQKFAIAIGLALLPFSPKSKNVNFRQKFYAYPHPWKRLKKSLLTFASLCLTFAAAMYLYCYTSLEKQRNDIKANYLKTLHGFGQTLPPKAQLSEWSDLQLSKEVKALERNNKAASSHFLLKPPLSLLHQVLYWMNSHPLIQDSSSTHPAFILDRLTYSMLSRPQEGNLSSPYRIRVDLEFRTATPQLARKFREALSTPNTLVNPNEEINWSNNSKTYHSSFFLNEQFSGEL